MLEISSPKSDFLVLIGQIQGAHESAEQRPMGRDPSGAPNGQRLRGSARSWQRDSWQGSGLVFATSAGTVVEPRNLSRTFEHLVQQSGVSRIRFHDLRHTCASLLLAQGVSPRVVMDVLGHSQLSITMDLYSHVMPSALHDAGDAMDRALSGGR
jgi:integrase